LTDANLLLGRLIPDHFPKIFGKSEKEPLDVQASKEAFEKLAREINDSQNDKSLSLDDIVYGWATFRSMRRLNKDIGFIGSSKWRMRPCADRFAR
jgi:N-methylhydantoinase A/oxoprolinase/acetone carboxylase beta subunit